MPPADGRRTPATRPTPSTPRRPSYGCCTCKPGSDGCSTVRGLTPAHGPVILLVDGGLVARYSTRRLAAGDDRPPHFPMPTPARPRNPRPRLYAPTGGHGDEPVCRQPTARHD